MILQWVSSLRYRLCNQQFSLWKHLLHVALHSLRTSYDQDESLLILFYFIFLGPNTQVFACFARHLILCSHLSFSSKYHNSWHSGVIDITSGSKAGFMVILWKLLLHIGLSSAGSCPSSLGDTCLASSTERAGNGWVSDRVRGPSCRRLPWRQQ